MSQLGLVGGRDSDETNKTEKKTKYVAQSALSVVPAYGEGKALGLHQNGVTASTLKATAQNEEADKSKALIGY